MTIDEILDEVESLDREGTPRPWLCGELSDGTRRVYPDDMEEDEHGCFPCVCEYAKDVDATLIAAYRSHAPALAAEVRRLRAQIDEGMACGLREPREQPRTVRTRWRVSGKIVSTLDEHEVEAIDREDAQHKAEADADNFAEWEEGPEIEEIDEELYWSSRV